MTHAIPSWIVWQNYVCATHSSLMSNGNECSFIAYLMLVQVFFTGTKILFGTAIQYGILCCYRFNWYEVRIAADSPWLLLNGLSMGLNIRLMIVGSQVVGAKIVTNSKAPGAQCFGLVTMSTSEEAAKCISHLHRTELHGRTITVDRVS